MVFKMAMINLLFFMLYVLKYHDVSIFNLHLQLLVSSPEGNFYCALNAAIRASL